VLGDRPPLDQLHHEVGPAVGGLAAVEQARDAGMVEAGEDLPFASEAAQDLRRVHAALDQLQGDAPLEAAVGQYVTGYLDRDDRYR